MKKFFTPITILLMVLVLLVGFFGFAAYQFGQAAKSLAADFSLAQSGPIPVDNKIFDMYAGIYENLEKYDATGQYEEQSTELANLVFQKTFKNAAVTSIQYQNDGFLVTISTRGIPLSSFSTSLVTSAITRSIATFLSTHLLDAAASLFQGEDAIKEILFKEYGQDVFQAMDTEISNTPDQNVEYVFQISQGEDGWTAQMISETVLPASSQS